MSLNEDQWSILINHNVDRQNNAHDIQMGYLEYIAMLVSPSPKDTLKAIEERHKILETKKRHAENLGGENEPVVIDASSMVFKNTTFYDTIVAEGGQEAAADVKNYFGDNGDSDSSKPVTYVTKPGQMNYFDRAIAAHQKGEELMPIPSFSSQLAQMHMDALEF